VDNGMGGQTAYCSWSGLRKRFFMNLVSRSWVTLHSSSECSLNEICWHESSRCIKSNTFTHSLTITISWTATQSVHLWTLLTIFLPKVHPVISWVNFKGSWTDSFSYPWINWHSTVPTWPQIIWQQQRGYFIIWKALKILHPLSGYSLYDVPHCFLWFWLGWPVTSMLNPKHIHAIWRISGSSEPSVPTSCIRFCFHPLGSLFFFHFPSTLILLLLSYAWIVTRLTIPLHLSFPSLHFMLDTPDPLIEQGTSMLELCTWNRNLDG
jgi:hypothetical protein